SSASSSGVICDSHSTVATIPSLRLGPALRALFARRARRPLHPIAQRLVLAGHEIHHVAADALHRGAQLRDRLLELRPPALALAAPAARLHGTARRFAEVVELAAELDDQVVEAHQA